jgi:hypothetical protein
MDESPGPITVLYDYRCVHGIGRFHLRMICFGYNIVHTLPRSTSLRTITTGCTPDTTRNQRSERLLHYSK